MCCYDKRVKAYRGFALTLPYKKQDPMGILRQIAEYLYLKKKDPKEDPTQWMKYMHGINRISIFLFILAMIILAIKLIRR